MRFRSADAVRKGQPPALALDATALMDALGIEPRVVSGGVGHNLPQEAPRAFADAVIDVAGW